MLQVLPAQALGQELLLCLWQTIAIAYNPPTPSRDSKFYLHRLSNNIRWLPGFQAQVRRQIPSLQNALLLLLVDICLSQSNRLRAYQGRVVLISCQELYPRHREVLCREDREEISCC